MTAREYMLRRPTREELSRTLSIAEHDETRRPKRCVVNDLEHKLIAHTMVMGINCEASEWQRRGYTTVYWDG